MLIPTISKSENEADSIYNEAAKNCEFFKDQNGDIYLVSYTDSKYDLKYLSYSNTTVKFLRQLYFERYNRTAKTGDVQNAYDTILANIDSCSDEIPVYKRVGQYHKTLYYDLLNNTNQVVKISKYGVEIIPRTDIDTMFFDSDKDMCEQSFQCENIEYSLIDFINDFFIVEENQRLLLAVYICTAFIPKIRHPILIVEGEKGAGKSTLLEKIWQIVNPVKKELFAIPHNKDGLITLLSNNYFCPIDNLGKINDEFANVLCQASTGGNLTKRKLYTDNTEFTINIKRIVALNGIDLGITQSDLLDRAILINLNRIDETKRLPMEMIDERFNKLLPIIMASIFEILSKALAIYPNVTLTKYPRMADFCRYGYAIAEAIKEGYGEKFIDEYYQNIDFAAEKSIEQSPLLEGVRNLVEKEAFWKGTATELLKKLHGCLREIYMSNSVHNLIPETPNALSRELKNHSHEFEKAGIKVDRGHSTDRYIKISKIGAKIPTTPTISTTKNNLNSQNRKTLLDED